MVIKTLCQNSTANLQTSQNTNHLFEIQNAQTAVCTKILTMVLELELCKKLASCCSLKAFPGHCTVPFLMALPTLPIELNIAHCPLGNAICPPAPDELWTGCQQENASVQQLMLHRHCTERGVLSSKCNFHCINSAVNASLSFLQFKLFARRLLIRKAL